MVKSRENKIDNLQFPWDHKAAQTLGTNQTRLNLELDLEWYFDWLSEIKPSRQELHQTKIFNQPFTLKLV
jgi:hypothetical protein